MSGAVVRGLTMDAEILETLQQLPEDLEEHGWWLDPDQTSSATDSYRVAYKRPFEPSVDDASVGTVHDGRLFTVAQQSDASWHDAYDRAVGAMRHIDARRATRAEGE
ncbi:MAG TPA: hypothetical protein VGW38_28370 [Chloroflexota bacterium]|nr:hypothetical protein [Chloroflexota bacterium]